VRRVTPSGAARSRPVRAPLRALLPVALLLAGSVPPAGHRPIERLDLFDTPASTVAAVHAGGGRAACYLDTDRYEEHRPDAGRFPKDVIIDGPGYRSVDVRRWDVLGPILADRLELCRIKGFDAVAVRGTTFVSDPAFRARLSALADGLDLEVVVAGSPEDGSPDDVSPDDAGPGGGAGSADTRTTSGS
jgi:Glycoside-hydrolase family GH114